MNDITTLGMVVTAKRDEHSPDIKITELQLFALTDNQVKEMVKEFDQKDISTVFLKFNVTDEASIRCLLNYTKFKGRLEDFEKAYDLAMTHADNDITEKLITLKQKGLFDSWLKGELKEEGSQVSTVETFVEPDESDVETLSSLLDRINDPTLKEEVLAKFKAALRSPE